MAKPDWDEHYANDDLPWDTGKPDPYLVELIERGTVDAGGHWLCLAGSTEGPAREFGPPRRSAGDLVEAVEPVLEVVELRSSAFEVEHKAWQLLARARDMPAQPATRRDG